jgi:hypothetical protein
MGDMALKSIADMAAALRGRSVLPVVAVVSLRVLGPAADVEAQSPDRVRLSLLEASVPAESRSCTLEVAVDPNAGEAILNCSRKTPPVSHLAAHRALTTSEAARLYALASERASTRPQSTGSSPPGSVDRPTVTITITRGTQREVLDVSDGPQGLSENDQQTWRLLRELADELRGTGRR